MNAVLSKAHLVRGQAESGVFWRSYDLCRKHGVSPATYYSGQTKYGGLSASELKRVKGLEAENAKLNRMYADISLKNDALKNLQSKMLAGH